MHIKNELLTEASLDPGDILFTMSGDEAGHASIYLGKMAECTLTIAHADNPEGYKLLMKTRLPDGDYIVYKCKDQKIAELAVLFADNWASYHTPYDEQRLQIGTKLHGSRTNSNNAIDVKKMALQACRKDFESMGKYRLVKYAARRGASINLPKGIGSGRGVWCAMFVLMCYQTAAIAKAGLVEPIVGDGRQRWVSDKYNDKARSDAYFESQESKGVLKFFSKNNKAVQTATANYAQYVERIRSKSEFFGLELKDFHKKYNGDHMLYPPSLIAWDFAKHGDIQAFNFEMVLSSGLMLEQKSVDPEILLLALSQDKKMWDRKGALQINAASSQNNQTLYATDDFKQHIDRCIKFTAQISAYIEGKAEQAKSPTYDAVMEGEKRIVC